MFTTSSKFQQFMLHAILPVVCSIIVGYALFQQKVFWSAHPAFQFIWSAVVASLFYNLLISVRSRDAWLGLILLTFFTFVTTHSTRPVYILRDLWYVAGIATAVFAYAGYFKRSGTLTPILGPLVFAGLLAVSNMTANLIHIMIIRTFTTGMPEFSILPLARNTASYGAMIGFGVGIGFVLADKFLGEIHGPADILWPPKPTVAESHT